MTASVPWTLVRKSLSVAAWLVVRTFADEAMPELFTKSVTSLTALAAAAICSCFDVSSASGTTRGSSDETVLASRAPYTLAAPASNSAKTRAFPSPRLEPRNTSFDLHDVLPFIEVMFRPA